jgi:hypothetical protein
VDRPGERASAGDELVACDMRGCPHQRARAGRRPPPAGTRRLAEVRFNGSVIATATCSGGGRWIVGAEAGRFTREPAIAAPVFADRLAAGYGDE